jgi:sulfur-oxidizing protein SoxZ
MANDPRIRTLIQLPREARRGEVLRVRATIGHPMESGFRIDAEGKPIRRSILRRFECRYDGELVFAADLYSAVAANPYVAFTTVAVASGTLQLRWTGDDGFAHTESVALTVL